MNKADKSKAKKIAVIGAGLAGLAASAYYFLGPKGKKHREKTKAWAVRMRGDVIRELEKARKMSGPIYRQTVDTVAREYIKGKKASKTEIGALAADLKKHWGTMSKMVRETKKRTSQDVSRVKQRTSDRRSKK